MAENIDDITMDFSDEEGNQVVKVLEKEVLTRGAWCTVMYKYQEMDPNTKEYKPEKFSIRRYQKTQGEFRQKSKFNISSADQAKQIIEVLTRWTGQ